ncbi:putative iroquois-like protein [Operophtera brumata]|uniref:Putative iroquois-like protein n=1 Tax=Operophtera brumata TaxID=104452 RepID=A0A0L7LVV2_OPEBR|nr:putative iroquois-like protein [Operophtera brumata]
MGGARTKFHITRLPFVGTTERRSEVAFSVSDDLPYFMFLPKDLSSSWIVSFMRIFCRNVNDERKGDEMLQGMHHQMLGYGIKEETKRGASDCGIPIPASKPKIWSLADTAACKTPPPAAQPWPQHAPASGAYGRYGGFPGAQYGAQHPCVHPAAFPDVQTDTPPQTPPNMKLPSVANPLGSGGGAGYCFPRHQQSPHRDPYHNPHHATNNHQPNQPHHNEGSAAFKPFYKRLL